jgi:hypothetical protein
MLPLSLIYHLYWKNKFLNTNKKDIPKRQSKLRKIYDYINNSGNFLPFYKILGNFGFETEEQFIKWLNLTEYSGNVKLTDFVNIEQKIVSNKNIFLNFDEFWKEYKLNINIDEFLNQHKNFIDIDIIKSQIILEIKDNKEMFHLIEEEDINTDKTNEIIKGFILVGLKARMYRTWISLLTQLDLAYTWNKNVKEIKMDSDVILDVKGIDTYCDFYGEFIGIQIKKRSQRHEALKIIEGEAPIRTINIPYDLNFESDDFLKDKLIKLNNGFIVFSDNYIYDIYNEIKKIIKKG